jgi:hypothetical protein
VFDKGGTYYMKFNDFSKGDVIGVIDCDACRKMLDMDAELKRVQTKEEFEELRIRLKEVEELCWACKDN